VIERGVTPPKWRGTSSGEAHVIFRECRVGDGTIVKSFCNTWFDAAPLQSGMKRCPTCKRVFADIPPDEATGSCVAGVKVS
jgi:hypothetical protein